MRLECVRLTNFRSCYDTTVSLSNHLTLLVGENDAGKSNIVDGLRAVVPPASGRQTLWLDQERDPSYLAAPNSEIVVRRTYGDLTAQEDAFYMPALVDAHRKLIHTTRFRSDPEVPRRQRLVHTVGDSGIPDPEPENRDRIAHVYLPPLRDAAAALDSAGGNRLADVFRMVATEAEIVSFVDRANQSLGELASDETARKVVTGVQSHLTRVTQPVRHRIIDVRHRSQRLSSLARSLRLHMAAEGLTPTDLLGSGLGYANLLFIATVVLELAKADEYDLLLLLVEEPEAHLHPQLQTVLLSYLEEQARLSETATVEVGQPAGRIQVIATTHSPHLASSLSTRSVVVVRCRDREGPDGKTQPVGEAPADGAGSTAAAAPPLGDPPVALPPDGEDAPEMPIRHTETVTVALASVNLTDVERRKVDRYLDATRGALLFARQVVLVEGIAEALLLRTLAERVVFPRLDDYETPPGQLNRQLREQFRAISVIPIGGVDFQPYVKLLLHDDVALADRVVVVTDGDGGAGALRRAGLTALFQSHVDSGCLKVVVGGTTLESELYALPQNEALLREAFRTQHPRSLQKWDELMPEGQGDQEARASAFSKALKEGTLDLGKGDFAQVVAELIQAGRGDFVVPPYLLEAIEGAVVRPGAVDVENDHAAP